MNKKQYVLIHCEKFPCYKYGNDDVLLILKDRPEWQKGFFNLVGGKVEKDEAVDDAVLRELKEETGYLPHADSENPLLKTGEIESDNEIVHCYRVHIETCGKNLSPREGETEIVKWLPWKIVRDDARLMPNLRVIIPLMFSNICGWNIYITENSTNRESYNFSFTMPSNLKFTKNTEITRILVE